MVCFPQAEDLAQPLAEEGGLGSLKNSLGWAFSLSRSNIVQAHDTAAAEERVQLRFGSRAVVDTVVKNLHAIF